MDKKVNNKKNKIKGGECECEPRWISADFCHSRRRFSCSWMTECMTWRGHCHIWPSVSSPRDFLLRWTNRPGPWRGERFCPVLVCSRSLGRWRWASASTRSRSGGWESSRSTWCWFCRLGRVACRGFRSGGRLCWGGGRGFWGSRDASWPDGGSWRGRSWWWSQIQGVGHIQGLGSHWVLKRKWLWASYLKIMIGVWLSNDWRLTFIDNRNCFMWS